MRTILITNWRTAMLGTAVIVFRETLEAALIVSIVLAATRGLDRRGLYVGSGIAAGLVGALAIASVAGAIAGLFQGRGQDVFSAGVLLAAVLMLGWHQLWMAEHGRALARELRTLSDSVRDGGATLGALAVAVALAVLREGAETVLFIQGLATSESTHAVLLGVGLGAAGGAVIGTLLYFGLVRIPVRHFFRVTGWMIVVLAAGLAAQAARFLEQADLLPSLVPQLWDTSGLLTETSLVGQLLHILVGYTAQPSGMQLVFYVVTLAVLIIGTRLRAIAPAPPRLPSAA
jgi:high-affinity iron transporter